MTRQVTDQLYIELDYFTPEEYYVYIAEASANITAEFTQSAQGFRTIETVLSAFSDAALTAEPQVIKSTTVNLSSEFSLAAASSGFENAEAALSSTATIDCVVTKTVSGLADISAEFSQITIGDRIIAVQVALESSVTMATVATRSVAFGSGLSSDADCACVNYRVRAFDSAVGALFNTAVQVTATINSFAVLDSVSSLAAQVDRQVGSGSAAFDTAFTHLAIGQRVRTTTSLQNSEFTVTAAALSFTRAQAALSSAATLTASLTAVLRPAGYIAWPDDYGTVLDDGRLSFTQRNTSNFALVLSDDTAEYANQLFASSNFTVEFLLTAVTAQFQGLSATTTNSDYYRSILNFQSGKLWIALRYSTSTTAILQFGVTNDAGTTFTLNTAGLSSLTGDSHIALVKSGTSLYAFVNGTRVNTTTVSGVFTLDSTTAATLGRSTIISVSRNNLICKIDELRFSIVARYANTATITVPSTPFANDKTGIALFHMDNTLSPAPAFDLATAGDNGLTLAAAALTAAFTQTANVERLRNVSGSADLSSSFALSAIIGSIEEISSSMFDDVELSATAAVTRTTAVSLSTEFTQTVTGTRIQPAVSSVSGAFTQVTDVQRTRTSASALASEFAQTTDGDLVADSNSSLGAQFTHTVTAARTRTSAVSLTTASALDTVNQRVRFAESAQASEFALIADVQRVQQAASALASEFAQTTDIDRFRKTPADLASAFVQTTTIDRIRFGLADVNGAFTQVVDAVRQQQGSASIASAFEQTTTASRTRNLESSQSSTLVIDTNAVKTVSVVIVTEAIATQLTAAAKVGDFLIDCAVTATVACAGSRVRFFGTLSEPRGVNLQNAVTGTDQGPFLLLDNVTSIFPYSTQGLLSFWTNRHTQGCVLNTDGTYLGNSNGSNSFIIQIESGNSFLYYYGNRAQEGIFPYVKWAINYANEELLHNFLIYIDSGLLSEPGTPQYKFYLDGVEQTLLEVSEAFAAPKNIHPFNIRDQLMLGYASNFAAAGNNSGYVPYDNLENTQPESAVLAQVWFDVGTAYDINNTTLRDKFYNAGWTDLGPTGTATGLAQPDYYARLRGYQDLAQGGTSTGDAVWQWKLFNNRDAGNFYNINNFSASPQQDNPYVTQIVASLTAGATVAALFAANLAGSSTVTATATRIQANSAALSSAFAVSANITVNIGTITDISAQFDLDLLGGRLESAGATQSSEFTVTALVGAIGDNTIDMFSQSAVSADVTVIPPVRIQAALSSSFAVQAIAGFEQQTQALFDSEFAVSADVTVIPPVRIEATLSSAFAVSVNTQGQFDSEAQLASVFTQSTVGQRLRRPSAGLQAQATVTTRVSRVVAFQANLPSVATQLTVASMIHLDIFYQYQVEAESRKGTVVPENRVFQVESETRVNMLL